MATLQQPTRVHGAKGWLAGIAVIYGGILFIVPTALRAAQPILFAHGNIPLPSAIWWTLWLISSLRRLLFSSTLSYLLVSIVGVLLVVASVIVTQRSRLSLALLLITSLGILAYPFLNVYRPALTAAPGYEMRVATQPGPLDGIVKATQASLEITPCRYTLLGWNTSEQLFYKEQCDGVTRTWLYDVAQKKALSVIAPPNTYVMNTCSDITVSEWVRAPSIYPPEMEPDVRKVYLEGNSRPSPNCRWTAVITRHVYGPEDVVLLRKISE
jgi:hypothetical protein